MASKKIKKRKLLKSKCPEYYQDLLKKKREERARLKLNDPVAYRKMRDKRNAYMSHRTITRNGKKISHRDYMREYMRKKREGTTQEKLAES
jgi:hypothetical protein